MAANSLTYPRVVTTCMDGGAFYSLCFIAYTQSMCIKSTVNEQRINLTIELVLLAPLIQTYQIPPRMARLGGGVCGQEYRDGLSAWWAASSTTKGQTVQHDNINRAT
eukprot:scaffold18498_cov186-Amphora_coffeaeformis.AAC.7